MLFRLISKIREKGIESAFISRGLSHNFILLKGGALLLRNRKEMIGCLTIIQKGCYSNE
jgi:hypothetical protein